MGNTKQHLLRAAWMDYRDPAILLITMVTTDRLPILGKLSGMTIERTVLGQAVAEEIEKIPTYKEAESIEIYDYVVMPDHVHILLRIHDRLPKHIGQYLAWFKIKCTDACCAITGGPVSEVIRPFAPEYHDRILKGKNQLQHMKRYIQDNPRRLALKKTNKELFTIQQDILLNNIPSTTMGNMFLAQYPLKQVIQCSRKLTQEQIDTKKKQCLAAAEQGIVHITAAISEGEKQIARALREAEYPIIILLQEGFPKPDSPHYHYYKPAGVYFETCAKGKLLLVEPHAEVLERPEIVKKTEAKVGQIPHDTKRYRFVAMNVVAEMMAEGEGYSADHR
jgi:hypothetical protein